MSVDTERGVWSETDRDERYTQRISEDGGETFRTASTGMSWDAVLAEVAAIEAAEDKRHLAAVVSLRGISMAVRGGPRDGVVWEWVIER